MDSARKTNVNIERLSSGDIFALLDSIKSDDEGGIENIMNDSGTEFVAEDESVIATNIIRKEETSDQSSSVSVPEASIHILSTQNEDETDTLGQDEPNFAVVTQLTSKQSPSPASQRTSNQSPFPANQRTVNQSPAAATQYTANQSPTDVVTRCTSNQSSKSTSLPTVTLPRNQETEAKLNDQRQNKKGKGQCFIRQEKHKPQKGQCSARQRQSKEEKNQYNQAMEKGG